MSVEVRRLGRTEHDVTVLGLGAFQLTSHFNVAEAEAARILALAAGAGVAYVDTAPMYADSERIVGRAIAAEAGWKPVLSTKVGYFDESNGDRPFQSPQTIRDSVVRSCERLGRERIDIVMIHEPEWPQWGLGPTGSGVVTDVLTELRESGLIGAIGVGGWGTSRIAELLDSGLFDVALVAGAFTLLDQSLRDEVLPVAARHDVGIVVGGAFGQGIPWLLSPDRGQVIERLRTGDHSSPNSFYRFGRRDLEKTLDLYDLADELAISMTELTVRYILGEERIHSHIAGAREASHLLSNLQAVAKGPLSPAVVARIEA